MKKRLLIALALGAAAAAAALILNQAGLLGRLEGATWAWRVRAFAPREKPSSQVQLILVDQSSLDWGAKEMQWSWPWPREVYSFILAFCKRASAKGVAFDILFTEPSAYGVDDDRALGKGIRGMPEFVGALFCSPKKTTLPIPEVRTNSTVLANVSDQPDDDGIFRRATLRKKSYLSLGTALYGKLDASVPLDSSGRMILRFLGTNGLHRAWNAAAIVQSEMNLQSGGKPTVDPGVFSNAYVLVGYSAPGLMDLRPTPISRVMPGVEIHATVLDNLLTRRFLRDLPLAASALAVLVLALAVAGLMAFCKKTGQSVAVILGGPLAAGALAFVVYPLGFAAPLVAWVLGALLAGGAVMILNYAEEGRQKAFIKGAFRHYLGGEVIDQMLAHPERLKLGGEKRELTAFFSDIEKFSTFSERLSPEDLTSLLNDYLSKMSAIIQKEGGYLDKYIGDAIVAFWNAPVDQPDHAARACRAAIRCQLAIAENRELWKARYGASLHARIGVNSGEAVVGNMGSHERFNYTMFGDNVNLASRLEGANKAFGTYIMVSEATRQKAGDAFGVRELARIRVVGRSKPVAVYELSTLPGGRVPENWPAFNQATERFRAGAFAEALDVFKLWPDDPAAAAYCRACERFLASPPANWDGVWNLDQK